MPHDHSIRLAVALAAVIGCQSAAQAQAPAERAAVTADAAFRSFVRVAQLTGRPAADLARIWPAPVGATSLPTELQLTAAHRLSVQLVAQPGGDALGTLRVVLYSERVADTLRLRTRVGDILQQLQATLGPPTQCSSPTGAPAYLYAPQDVQRVWERGFANAPTALRWEVSKDALPTIMITVGMVPTSASPLLACDARMP